MTVIVTACSSFVLTVSEIKTEVMYLQTNDGGEGVSFNATAAGKQTAEFEYLGGAIGTSRDLRIEVTRRLQRGWACFGRSKMELYGRPGVRLRLEARLLKAVVIHTNLYGCVMWSPKPPVATTERVLHLILLRCLGWRKRKRGDQTLSYAHARQDSKSVEVTVRRRRLLTADFVARIGEEHLPRRAVFGEMVGGNGYFFGRGRDRMKRLEEDLDKVGIRSKGRRETHRRPADSVDGSRTGPRLTCGNRMVRRRALQKSDTRRPQIRHGPWTPMHPRGGREVGGGERGDTGGDRGGGGSGGREWRGGRGMLCPNACQLDIAFIAMMPNLHK